MFRRFSLHNNYNHTRFLVSVSSLRYQSQYNGSLNGVHDSDSISSTKTLFTELQLPKSRREQLYRETGLDKEDVDEKAPIYLNFLEVNNNVVEHSFLSKTRNEAIDMISSTGFVFGGRALDGKTIIYVNVCGHDDIMAPQGPSGIKVDDAYLDKMGVENLQIPIAVGNPVEVVIPSAATTSTATTKKIQEVDNAADVSNQQKVENSTKKKSSSAASTTAPLKQFIIEVVIHKMIADRCRCVWNTGGTPKDFDEKVQPERKMVVFRIARLALDWVQREAGLVIAPDSVRLIFNTAYQTPPSAKHTSEGATGKNASENSLPSPAEMMEFMKRMAERQGDRGSGENTMGKGSATSSMEENIFKNLAAAQQQQQQAKQTSKNDNNENNKSSSSLLSGEEDRTSMIFSANKKNSEPQEVDQKKSKGPLIQEILQASATTSSSSSAIKKGFLNNSKGSLYGEKGTSEGVLPDGAGDPIGYMPKAFREKCKVVDMRSMGNDSEQMLKAIEAAEKTTIGGKPIAQQHEKQSKQEENKMVFSHQQQKQVVDTTADTSTIASAPSAVTKSSAIVIEEIDSEKESNNNDNNFQSATDWKLSSVRIDDQQSAQNLVVTLQTGNANFAVSDLELEVTSSGFRGQSEESEKKLFSVGDVSKNRDYRLSDWKRLFFGDDVGANDFSLGTNEGGCVVQLDSENSKAKYKKASKELTLTIPLLLGSK